MQDRYGPNWRQITLFLLTFSVLIAVALIARPFIDAFIGALAIVVVTQRPYRWLLDRIRRPNLCAAIALILITLSIIVPSIYICQYIGVQIGHVIAALRSNGSQQAVTDYFQKHPTLTSHIQTVYDTIDLQHVTQTVGTFLGAKIARFIGSSLGAVTQIFIMLFVLFYFYRDTESSLNFLRAVLPLDDEETTVLLSRAGETINATVLGRIVIALVQGSLGGIAYWALGVPNAFLWGVVTALMSIIPALGTPLVWAPIALYLGYNGQWLRAAILAIWGAGVVSTVDNFLYPMMVGSQIKQHSMAVLVSILGGVALFGFSGIILGPLIFTVASTLLEFWKEHIGQRPPISQ